MWNTYRFSFRIYIYFYATDRWTFLKHLFHHIIFLLKNIKAPRCGLEERGDHLCKHVIPLSPAPEHPHSSWGCEFCVSHSCPAEEKEHIGPSPRPLDTVAPCTVPFFCGPSYTGPGGTCHLEVAPNANLRRDTPQCLDDRAKVSWLLLLFSLQNEIMCQLKQQKKKGFLFAFSNMF